jgi:hypothetical protein
MYSRKSPPVSGFHIQEKQTSSKCTAQNIMIKVAFLSAERRGIREKCS